MYIGKNTLNWQVTWFEIPEIRKLWQLSLLKSAMDSYHKIATGITNCDGFYKLREIRSFSLFILSQAASLSYRIFIVASRAASRL